LKSRKLPPPARFILTGALFHRKGSLTNEPFAFPNKPWWPLYIFCFLNFLLSVKSAIKTRWNKGLGVIKGTNFAFFLKKIKAIGNYF
jgi:hypothetical protein